MCGIAGLLTLDGRPADPEAVRTMTRRLAHRGPDGEGVVVDGPIALGNRRLAILDLSVAGAQPMKDVSGRFTITFNGEIYNYVELRHELLALGSSFRSQSDTEVLLAGFVRWGPDVVRRLNGMFAFAIWDSRERTLFAARDRFGEKPFYYRVVPEKEFRFASEIKAIVPPGSGQGRCRPQMLFRFLAYGHAGDADETFFDDIHQLPAAHTLTVIGGRVTCVRYWTLPEERPSTRLDEADAVEEVRALVSDSVRLRMRSDVAVGTSLSGGLDSSTIVIAVSGQIRTRPEDQRKPQASFSACFPSNPMDESRYIDVVAAAAGVTAHRVCPSGQALRDELPALIAAQDEPIGGPSVFAQWKVMQLAREKDVTVLLDGQGADEVFGGYSFYFGDFWWSLLRNAQLRTLRRETNEYEALHGVGSARQIFGPALRGRLRRSLRVGIRRGTRWLSPDFERTAGVPLPPPSASLRQSLRHSQHTRMLPHLLRYADRNSMAFSREVRLPFLDHRLVELVDGLDDRMKIRGGTTKWALREAVRGDVPEAVRARRDKVAFAVPAADWMRGPMSDSIQDTLLSKQLQERGIYDAGAVERALASFLGGDDEPSPMLWRVFAAELWMRTFVDGAAAAP